MADNIDQSIASEPPVGTVVGAATPPGNRLSAGTTGFGEGFTGSHGLDAAAADSGFVAGGGHQGFVDGGSLVSSSTTGQGVAQPSWSSRPTAEAGSAYQTGRGKVGGQVGPGSSGGAGQGRGGNGRSQGKAPVGPSGPGNGGSGGFGGNTSGSGGQSPSLGLQRKQGRKRVIGASTSVKPVSQAVVKSYVVSGAIQFNDVEELRGDAISRAFAQELLERVWSVWGIDTSSPQSMRKAEDMVHGLFAMRTASPDADYSVFAMVGGKEVSLDVVSTVLAAEEVTRRRFARAIADDIRDYIADPDNVRLREMLATELGVKVEYVALAFDGSTHCSGMSTNQVMFTKQLERMNLFDTVEVRDRMSSNQMLSTGQFQVNRGRGGYT